MKEYVDVLKKNFGFDEFREHQLEIIKAIIEDKKDVCAVMFTGAGKSLCYQFPPVFEKKVAIIISPLISLMDNQQMKMDENDITSVCLNSTIANKFDLKKDILKNKFRLVYMTPEYLITQQDFILELHKRNILSLFGIDECHVLSIWSQEFRVSYKKLNCLKKWLPDIPIIAMTATATSKVQDDIINILKLKKPLIVKTTFDRPNLMIKVLPKSGDILKDLLPQVKGDDSIIIYCQTRKNTDNITKLLKKKKISCDGYHAGMNSDERDRIHKEFMSKKIKCIIATVAFGMGIDATIRKVIHYGIPKDMESYYQEIGRAGRDGKKSECIILYALSDSSSNDYIINQIKNEQYRDHRLEIASVMKNYIFSYDCRRKYILEYFGEVYDKENCQNCDNCINNAEVIKHDFKREGKMILNLIKETGNMYGAIMLINILKGSGAKKIPKNFKKLSYFGKGNIHNDKWWKIFIRMLINNQYITEKSIRGGHGFFLTISDKGLDWLENDEKLLMQVPNELKPFCEIKKTINLKLDLDDSLEDVTTSKKTKTKTKTTMDMTYDLFQNQKKTLKEISDLRDISLQTLEEHIVKLFESGKELDLVRLGFTDLVYKMISNKIKNLKDIELKTIKNLLPKNISYLFIKLTISRMKTEKDDLIEIKGKKKNDIDDLISKSYMPDPNIEKMYKELLIGSINK